MKKIIFVIFLVTLVGCGTSKNQRLKNEFTSVAVPALDENKKCESSAIKTQKSKCFPSLIKSIQSLDSENPIKSILVNYIVEVYELSIKYDNGLIDEQMYELGKIKARNNFSLNSDNLRARERAIQAQNNNNTNGALAGSALCMAFAKNSQACMSGALETVEDDGDKLRKLQNLQMQNQQRIQQLEMESQNKKINSDLQEKMRNSSKNCRLC